jgi:FHA domain
MTLERIIDKLRQWRRPWTSGTEPLEIHRAVLEDVEAQVVAVGGGRRVFPFDRVEIKLFAAAPEERTRLEAVAAAGWDLEREVKQLLAARDVQFPAGLAVTVAVTAEGGPEAGGRRYALAFGSSGSAAQDAMTGRPAAGGDSAAPARGARPRLRVAVLKGQAARDSYDLDADHIYLGRLDEVLDTAGRVKRRNDVAFLEEGECNQTVSREHARIVWDLESRSFWLRDEGSASGTLLFRAGRSIEVSRHDRRGVRLANGDEIYLGRAAVKVEILPGQPAAAG